jgi:hypothetical protein
MPKRVKKAAKKQTPPKDVNQWARHMVEQSTSGPEPDAPPAIAPEALSAYMAKLGKKGGDISGERRKDMPVEVRRRRYTRLSNGFSRKLENHEAAVALNYFAYNFIKIHRTLRVTPAMAAKVTDRLFDVADIVALLEASESKKAA